MVTRDKSGSFTIEQLKRQYNLDNQKVLKVVEQQNQNLIKVENELDSIMTSIIINLGELLENQGDISLWFFDGIPTLENAPHISWGEPTEHEGDLYFDRQTGIVYKFINNTWLEQTDKELSQAMALTNTETDIDDNERKVFFTTPTVPYKSGDWWIKEDGTLYICQIGKEEGSYEEQDFIISSGYKDAVSIKNINDFTILNGKVTTIEKGIEEVKTTIEENKYFVDSEGNKQLISESVSEVTQTLDSVEVSLEEFKTNVEENYSTTTNLEELRVDLENGITNTFSTSGGNNLIRNSALLFKESEEAYEFWEGSLKRNDEEDSSETGTALLIQKEKCSQNIEALAGNYFLSFKYKKLIELSTLSVFLNGVEYQLITGNDESAINESHEYELPIKIDNPNITIEFVSNTDSGVEIYDLMLNKGEIKALYTQHQNETTTNTVKIGKGIRVESSETDTVTKIDSDGFRVLNKNNEDEVLLKGTDKGTYTKTLECENEATISGLFIQKVDEQVWITGL